MSCDAVAVVGGDESSASGVGRQGAKGSEKKRSTFFKYTQAGQQEEENFMIV